MVRNKVGVTCSCFYSVLDDLRIANYDMPSIANIYDIPSIGQEDLHSMPLYTVCIVLTLKLTLDIFCENLYEYLTVSDI